jgi:hypothetical protein
MKQNKDKWDSKNETRKKFMKQIEILPLKKRNEISFFLFRKTSKIL